MVYNSAMSVVKSATIISASILSSRVLGLVRDIVIAVFFGANALTDAFFVAFRIPNMLRRIFAEGAFSSAFTPSFTKRLKEGREKARLFAGRFLSILAVSLILTVILGEVLAPFIVKAVAPGFSKEYADLATSLTREMFPYIVLVSLVAFYGGVLNSFEHFFAPAFSTSLFNLSIIASAILLKPFISIHSLAIGVLIGGTLQVILQLLFLNRFSFWIKPKLGIDENVRKTLRNIIPGIFGFGVRQLSMLIDTILASFLSAGAISFLYYANRFVQLPLGMFAVGVSQVLLPKLSKHSDNRGAYLENLKEGTDFTFLLIIPSTLGLIFFGKPILDLILHHGRFTGSGIESTYLVLAAYSSGLVFFSLEKILTNALYSLDNYKFPVRVASLMLIFNFFADLILCFPMKLGVFGLALGTSLTSALTVIFLMRKVNAYVRILPSILKSALSYAIASVPIPMVSELGRRAYFLHAGATYRTAVVAVTILTCVAIYLILLIIRRDRFVEGIIRRRNAPDSL